MAAAAAGPRTAARPWHQHAEVAQGVLDAAASWRGALVFGQVSKLWRALSLRSAERVWQGPCAEYLNAQIGDESAGTWEQFRDKLLTWVSRMPRAPAVLLFFEQAEDDSDAGSEICITPGLLSALPRKTKVVWCAAEELVSGSAPGRGADGSWNGEVRCCAIFDGAAPWSAAGRGGYAVRHTVHTATEDLRHRDDGGSGLGPLCGAVVFAAQTHGRQTGAYLKAMREVLSAGHGAGVQVGGGLCSTVRCWSAVPPARDQRDQWAEFDADNLGRVSRTAAVLAVWGHRAALRTHQFRGSGQDHYAQVAEQWRACLSSPDGAPAAGGAGPGAERGRGRHATQEVQSAVNSALNTAAEASSEAEVERAARAWLRGHAEHGEMVARGLPGFSFPCVARQQLRAVEEASWSRHFPEHNLLGFYCGGEIAFETSDLARPGPAGRGAEEMHGYTTVWALWGEQHRPRYGPLPPPSARQTDDGRTRLRGRREDKEPHPEGTPAALS